MWRMKHTFSVAGAAVAGLALAVSLGMGHLSSREVQGTDGPDHVRIGVYDNRAIAIAYVGSRYNAVNEKMKEYDAAKRAGDETRIKELEAWGEKLQRQLHRQGFGRVPVSNLLEAVEDQLPELAQRLDIDAIAFECNYTKEGVEEVDITMELVRLFEPSDQSLKWAEDALTKEPLDLDEIEQNHDH